MRKILFILLVCFSALHAAAQIDSTDDQQEDVDTPALKAPPSVKNHPKRHIRDSLSKVRSSHTFSASDSLFHTDTTRASSRDSIKTLIVDKPAKVVLWKRPIDFFYLKMLDNSFLRTKAPPVFLVISERNKVDKDEMFYLLSGIVLFLAFVKLLFSRYFLNLFTLFFQPTFRQKQTREQLAQSNLPSLLLNLFFVFSSAAYISLLINYYQLSASGFWFLFIYSTTSLLILYAGKYILLSFAGWVFNVKEATETYIFIVYLINKILGVLLIPFILIIAFSRSEITSVAVTISLCLIVLLFLYRYVASAGQVRRDVKVSPLHFLFYVLAFEVTPLLLIYKTLSIYLTKTT